MTSQREVADAFFARETSPRRASNFKMVPVDSETAFLVGCEELVYAKRELFGQFAVYLDRLTWSGLRSLDVDRSNTIMLGALRDQQRTVQSAMNNIVHDDNEYDVEVHGLPPQPVSNFPELQEELQ